MDPTSTSDIELGTFQYPFKMVTFPFKELFNYYIDAPSYTATIYIKEGTTNTIYTVLDPIIILGAASLTITGYGSNG